MSLVGYRPELPELSSLFTTTQRVAREAFKPGCTGLWQLSDHGAGLMLEHPQYDEFYARNQSVALDLWLLVQTPLVHLRGGKLSIDTVPGALVNESRVRLHRTPELVVADLPRSA